MTNKPTLADFVRKLEHRQGNRREFFGDSVVVAAAAAASVHAEAEASPSRSPNERLGVAVAGVRGRGNTHLAAFSSRADCEVVCICDPDAEVGGRRVGEVAKRQRGRRPAFVEDLRSTLDDPRVDVVCIATPNHWHALAAVWAMEAGKDVYLEVPVCHHLNEGQTLVETARRTGRICQAGLQARSNPGMRAAIADLHSGQIGDVQGARVMCFRRPPSPIGEQGLYWPDPKVNYDLWLGPAARQPLTRASLHHSWRWQWPYGCGELGGSAVHLLDIARWGLNLQHLRGDVGCIGGRYAASDAGETPDTLHAELHWDRPIRLQLRTLPESPVNGVRNGVVFDGTQGQIVLPGYHSGYLLDANGRQVKQYRGKGDHFANLVAAIRSRQHTDLNADVAQGVLSAAMAQLIALSYRVGHTAKANSLQATPTADGRPCPAAIDSLLSHLEKNGVAAGGIQRGATLHYDSRAGVCQGPPEQAERLAELLAPTYRSPFQLSGQSG